jgi:hypothetical protein
MNKTNKGSSATNRLKVKLNAELAKTHDVVWKRPDELQALGYRDGVDFVTPEDGCEFTINPSGNHFEIKSTLTNETELVAIKIPKKVREALLSEPAERSKKRVGNFDQKAIEDVKRSGGIPLTPEQMQRPFRKLV